MPPQAAEKSWPEITYPSKRDDGIPSVDAWLEGKQLDDGADGLWRVHDKLYDLNSFIMQHPGGAFWLTVTKGTDITEAFESHHLTPVAEINYYLNFTFEMPFPLATLLSPLNRMDLLFISALTFAVCSAKYESVGFAALAGIMFTFVLNCAHNFIHMKDNMWRSYYYYFVGFSLREWRISHCLSHHLYPNTLKDIEITFMEPLFQFLPRRNKSVWIRYGPLVYFPLFWALSPFFQIFNRIRSNKFFWPDYLLFVVPSLMLIIGKFQIHSLFLWIVFLLFFGSISSFIGFTAAHHDHKAFHEGDKARNDRDWGLHQVDTTYERKEVTGNIFLGLVVFGEHTLHHLFPTIDHVYLTELIPIYEETLKEFGVELNEKSYPKVIAGTFLQLARNKPNLAARN